MTDAALPRLLAALFFLGLLLLAERRWPFRALPRGRWWPNLGLAGLNAGLLALLPALSALFAAQWAARHQLGLLHWLALPDWLALPLAFLALDAAVYAQHRAMHHWPLLWRLHRVHHADPGLDVTSGLRFHPAEALVSALYKAAVTVLLGAPPAAVLAFVLALNLGALFSHANLRLSNQAERRLRRLLVTPGMHRIHHSRQPREQRRNYGFFSPWWDQAFGSYQAEPEGGERALRIGLDSDRGPPAGLADLLWLPWRPDGDPPASDTMTTPCKTPPDSKP